VAGAHDGLLDDRGDRDGVRGRLPGPTFSPGTAPAVAASASRMQAIAASALAASETCRAWHDQTLFLREDAIKR